MKISELKNYIPFYIGCNAKTLDGVGKIVGMPWQFMDKSRVSISFNVMRNTLNSCDSRDKRRGFGDYEIKSIKLLLRPLSSMTEEEAIELCKFDVSKKRHENIDIHEIQDTHIWYTDGEMWYGDGVSEMCDKYLNYNNMSPNQMHWLLFKGFDIFGLIESGLALDATKIEKV